MEVALRIPLAFAGHVFKPCRDRLFEWCTGGMMLGIATMLWLWPHSIAHGSYRYMLAVGFSVECLMVTFLLFGVLRGAALVANGTWPQWGPRCRALGAAMGAFMWAQMFMALASYSSVQGPSIGLPVYLFLTLGELFSCFRAATDVRTRISR